MSWISVDDEKPHLGAWVLGYTNSNDYGEYEIVYYHNGFWFSQDYQVPVTHWQPLPQPPEDK